MAPNTGRVVANSVLKGHRMSGKRPSRSREEGRGKGKGKGGGAHGDVATVHRETSDDGIAVDRRQAARRLKVLHRSGVSAVDPPGRVVLRKRAAARIISLSAATWGEQKEKDGGFRCGRLNIARSWVRIAGRA